MAVADHQLTHGQPPSNATRYQFLTRLKNRINHNAPRHPPPLQVHTMANKTFAPLLQRQAHVATLQRSQRLLARYEVLLQLPSRLRQAAAQQDYEQLLTDYRSAKMLRGGLSQVPGSAVWSPLWEVRGRG